MHRHAILNASNISNNERSTWAIDVDHVSKSFALAGGQSLLAIDDVDIKICLLYTSDAADE